MASHLDDVNELLKLNKGDIGRLKFIKDSLEKNKPLYSSDKEYLENLTDQYLKEKIQEARTSDIPDEHTSSKPQHGESTNNKTSNFNQFKSFCIQCGSKLSGENFCPKCGSNQTPNPSRLKKRSNFWYLVPIIFSIVGGIITYLVLRKSDSSKAKKCLVIGIVIFILWSAAMISSSNSNIQPNKEAPIKKPELTMEQIKDSAMQGVDYDSLMRYNEKYVGKILYLEGEVIQTTRTYGDNYLLRVSITKDNLGFGTTYYKDPIWVNYHGDRVLENDIVGIYGKVKGIKEYTAVLGNTISIPEVESLSLEVLKLGITK